MNAEIYYLPDQEGLIAGLAETLRARIYPGLEVKLQRVSFGQREVIELGRRYIKLLQASIRPEKGFQLDLTVLEHQGYRFYIYIYYTFSYAANKKFQQGALSFFFPAVAVRNRMVLVPSGLGRELELNWNEQLMSPFTPPEMGGAAEVNFSDRAAVAMVLEAVAQTTQADLLQEIRAYASFRNPSEISVPALAHDLDIDAGFLQQLFQTGVEHAFYDQLTCEIAPSKIAFDRWTKVILSVRNDSDISLSNLQAKISGPVEILPTRIRINVAARSTATVQISLNPTRRGEFPLELVLVLPDEQVFSSWLPEKYLWLECD